MRVCMEAGIRFAHAGTGNSTWQLQNFRNEISAFRLVHICVWLNFFFSTVGFFVWNIEVQGEWEWRSSEAAGLGRMRETFFEKQMFKNRHVFTENWLFEIHRGGLWVYF